MHTVGLHVYPNFQSLALAIIENDFGLETSHMVARKLVLYQRRGGSQSQLSALLEMAARSDRVQITRANDYVTECFPIIFRSELALTRERHVATLNGPSGTHEVNGRCCGRNGPQ